jgi:Ribosomal protein L4/L1 family.
VASKGSNIISSAANIAGVDSCSVDEISIERLAPGAEPRLVIWSSKAVEGLESAIEAKGEKKVL